jgi:hypothetical protein
MITRSIFIEIALVLSQMFACSSDNKGALSASGGIGITLSSGGSTQLGGTTSAGGETTAAGGDNSLAGGGGQSPTGGATSASGGTSAISTKVFDGSCASLPGTIIYVESGDTQENLLKNLGRHLRDTANITLVYNLTGSCTLTSDIYTGAKMVPNGTLKYVPSTAENSSWTASAAALTCTTPSEGVAIDVAISALFVQSCGLGGAPSGSNLALIQGPVQAYTFIVPTASDQSAIWAEEAYYAFGFGNANPIAPTYNPWNDEQSMFVRPATKSTLVATAKNIAVPPNKWKGVPEAGSSDVVTAVSTATNPEAAIGILGSEVYDGKRGPTPGIKMLAFKAFGQNLAYYADSSASSFDKQNVRDGHYTLWSPTVYITKVDASNVPVKPEIKYFIDLVLGKPSATPPAGATVFDALADVVKVGLIPDCAMNVTRGEDGGNLSPYTPAASCTCFYLSKITGASGTPAGCAACTVGADCSGGKSCNHGYCEPSGVSAGGIADGTCYVGAPTTHAQIINACSASAGVKKNVVLPSATLTPLP